MPLNIGSAWYLNPFKDEVTSAAVELVNLALGVFITDEVRDGLIEFAVEINEGLFLYVWSSVVSLLSLGVALKKQTQIFNGLKKVANSMQ